MRHTFFSALITGCIVLFILSCDATGIVSPLPSDSTSDSTTPQPGPSGPDSSPAKSDNAKLSALTPSSGTLVPAFSPDQLSYTIHVYHQVASLSLSAVPQDDKASVSPGSGALIPLAVGTNDIQLVVTAENGTSTKTYNVSVQRSPNYWSAALGELIYVPAGKFQRDATVGNISQVSEFRIGQYEVTRAQWVALMGTDPSDLAYSTGTDNPVQNINWYHAVAFCNKLSLSEGLTPVYSVSGVDWSTLTYAQIPTVDTASWNAVSADWEANGYRLPTEMEWMWAAMGAPADGRDGAVNTSAYSKYFAGSTGTNLVADYVWTSENSGRKTQKIGTKLPNELQLFDMNGNIREACWDYYSSPISSGLLIDYRGPVSGTGRVGKGFSVLFSFLPSTVLGIVERTSPAPGIPSYSGGFRVVRR